MVEVTIGWDGGFLVYRCRCHTGPRCRCKGTRRLSRQAGGRRRWHWLDGTTEKVRAAKTRGREERGHCCRQGKEDNLVPARIQSITCTLMHTEKQTLPSGKLPGQERLHRPQSRSAGKFAIPVRHTALAGKRTKGINRNGKERGHLAPAGALSTRRS